MKYLKLHELKMVSRILSGVVIEVLNSQSRGPDFKITGDSMVCSAFHPGKVNEMSSRNFKCLLVVDL